MAVAHPLTERFFRFLLARRVQVLWATGGLTLFFAALSARVPFTTYPMDVFPARHDYVRTFLRFEETLGGPDMVRIVLEAREGDVFTAPFLAKIDRITRALEELEHVHPYQIWSLSQKKVKDFRFDAQGNFIGRPLMWPDPPRTWAEIDELRRRALNAPGVVGTLLSPDLKAAAIDVGFLSSLRDYEAAYSRLRAIVERERDAATGIHMIGRPVLIGQILEDMPRLAWIFAATALSIILILFLYFRSFLGMLIPVLTAALCSVWGLGFLGLSGVNFDPLIIVVPFLLSARALSHSIQFVDRVEEELARSPDKESAIARACARLIRPAFLAIAVDGLSIWVLLFLGIPLLKKLALLSCFWVGSILTVNFLVHPAILYYLPLRRRGKTAYGARNLYLPLARWFAAMARGASRRKVLAPAAVLCLLSAAFSRKLAIGDDYAGSFLLWPDSRYNRDTEWTGARFGSTDVLTVVAEAASGEAFKDPRALQALAAFQRALEELPGVAATSSIADYFLQFNRLLHGGDPRDEIIPADRKQAAFLHYMIFNSAEPGDLDAIIAPDSTAASVTVYLKDHRGETLRQVIGGARAFIAARADAGGLHLRLAGGPAGLLAALNETIAAQRFWIMAFTFLVTWGASALSYGSRSAAFVVMLPMVVVNFLADAFMALKGIALSANTLPVVCLGVGLGVDYGIYLLSRIQEEFQASGDLHRSILAALSTSGKAVTLTAATMVLSCVFWFWSFLRFQAEMAGLLAFWMILSWLGAMILVPSLTVAMKPSFLRPAQGGSR